MKTRTCIFLLLTVVFACRKEQGTLTNSQPVEHELPLTAVQSWYQKQAIELTSGAASLAIDWTHAESIQTSKGNYWLVPIPGQPTFQGAKQGYRKLAFIRDSLQNIRMRILEIIPDAVYWQRKGKVTTADFTGYIFSYDQRYHLMGGKIYANGQQIGESKPGMAKPDLTTNTVSVSTDCNWYDSYYIDAEGNVVIHSDRICSYTVYDDGFNPDSNYGSDGQPTGDPLGGGGGSSSAGAPEISNLPGETGTKIDTKDYVRCFGSISNSGASMSVTLYVQQPFPGTTFNIGPNSVGHTAIGLSKTNGNTTITQTVGFYPDATGKSKMHAPSKVLDNGGALDYNLSITYQLSADQFQAVLDYINTPPPVYDLIENNCTSFAIHALANSGILAPPSYSVVGLNGAGGVQTAMTPAGLGDSISSMKGQSGVNTTGGHVGPSHGPCN